MRSQFTFILSALAAAVLFTSSAAQAQVPGWLGGSRPAYAGADRVSYYEMRRVAHDNGYREGFKIGERDARRGNRFWFENERTFQRADKGYHRSYGDIERYRQSFRSGFAAGYQDGYERITRVTHRGSQRPVVRGSQVPGGVYYPSQPRYAYSVAFENGQRDGYDRGLDDGRRSRRFDPRGHRWYREGDRGYDRRHGSRDEYKDLYRRGFQQGYEQGYRDSRGRW